jgi:hypothetical protein
MQCRSQDAFLGKLKLKGIAWWQSLSHKMAAFMAAFNE